MRTPNSCRRWFTENDITPYIPTEASTIATSAEDREHRRDDPVLRDEAVDLHLRRADEVERQVRVGLRASAAAAAPPSRRRAGRRAAWPGWSRTGSPAAPAASGPPGSRRTARRSRSRPARLVERPEHPHGRDDADDGAPRPRLLRVAVARRGPEAAAERALAGEVLLRERRVDDRDGLVRVEIVGGEGAAVEHPLAGHREEAAGHLLEVGRGAIARSRYCRPRSRSGCCPRTPCGSDWSAPTASNSGSVSNCCRTRS